MCLWHHRRLRQLLRQRPSRARRVLRGLGCNAGHVRKLLLEWPARRLRCLRRLRHRRRCRWHMLLGASPFCSPLAGIPTLVLLDHQKPHICCSTCRSWITRKCQCCSSCHAVADHKGLLPIICSPQDARSPMVGLGPQTIPSDEAAPTRSSLLHACIR